ncbi:MAG: 50S ribosomal protein L17 [Bacteroidetes bacterium HGW-Bacteroidetes-6]|jgi:large subunit ribosomal protein L17|nr:MAG: 50S ribosomal protein L17 [Bacteroidetes bacterium HGW-Bacteroidetes-6]
MRHKNAFNKLGRKTAHRAAMLSNMACSLIMHKRINTTLQKAKALRGFVEPVITLSKDDTMNNRRLAFKYLQDKEAVKELFREISNKVADRPGGYTRILKTAPRLGDNADMCMMELVDYNENMLSNNADAKKTTGRTRRSKVKKTDEVTAPVAKPKAKEVAAPAADETPVAEVEETPVAQVEETPETSVEEAPEVADEPVTDEPEAKDEEEK